MPLPCRREGSVQDQRLQSTFSPLPTSFDRFGLRMGRSQHPLLDKETGVYSDDKLIVLKTTRMPAVLTLDEAGFGLALGQQQPGLGKAFALQVFLDALRKGRLKTNSATLTGRILTIQALRAVAALLKGFLGPWCGARPRVSRPGRHAPTGGLWREAAVRGLGPTGGRTFADEARSLRAVRIRKIELSENCHLI